MRLTLVTPFRVPLHIPKYRLLAHNPDWERIVGELREDINRLDRSRLGLTELELGNYGWGRARDAIYEFGSPGWYFRDYYLLRFGASVMSPDFHLPEAEGGLPAGLCAPGGLWQCWLIGNTVGLLALEIDFDSFSDFLRYAAEDRDALSRFTRRWPNRLLAPGGPVRTAVTEATRWCRDSLVPRMAAVDGRFRHDEALFVLGGDEQEKGQAIDLDGCLRENSDRRYLFTEAHPIYPRCFRGLWTHPAYSLDEGELTELKADDEARFDSAISAEQLKSLREGRATYGWGVTTRLIGDDAEQRVPDQWRDALCVQQYYYSCFDIADTKLPVTIARTHADAIRGKHNQVLASARRTRATINILVSDYEDLRARAANEAHKAIEGYHDSWRFPDLVRNLQGKLKLLEEMMATSSDAIDKRGESTIQLILFAITLVSVLGLTASIHDYLVGGYEGQFMDPLHQVALGVGKGNVIIFSLLAVFAMLVIYFFFKLRQR